MIDQKLYYYNSGKNKLIEQGYAEGSKEITNFIQSKMNSENLHFFLGSGCSYPAINLMGNTFDKIKPELLEINGEILGKFNSEDNNDSKNIEAYLNWLKNGIEFLDKEDGEDYQKAFNIVRKRLIESITKSEKYTCSSDDNVKQTMNNYQEFYKAIFNKRQHEELSPVNIFTSNYDLFNEVSLDLLGMHYTNGFRGIVQRVFDPSVYRLRLVDDENRYKDKWSIVRNYVKLYKVHGSIDWIHKDNNDVIQTNEGPIPESQVIIYPTIGKHTETQGSPYSELFREFLINLQKKNSTLCVIGYGFPDEHINQLISQSLNNDDFNLIVFGNIEEKNAYKFYQRHKNKDNFHFIGGFDIVEANGSQEKNHNGHHFDKVISFLGGSIND